jgi:hypothetical protein
MTRKQRDAIRLRDAALHKLRADGAFEPIKGLGPCIVWQGNGLSLSLRTPFQKLRHPRHNPHVIWLAGPPPENPPYGLDIWMNLQKVLNLEWADDQTFVLVSFRRGSWEATVRAFDKNG